MQDRYFGDVGDFGKYGLLRALCGLDGALRLKLGVVWYLFPNEDHNADGKHLGYLRKPKEYRDCDEQLYDLLQSLVFDRTGQLIEGARQIKHAETSGIFPKGTQFYSKPLSFPPGLRSQDRKKLRENWYAAARAVTAENDLVFVDPDNGIECSKSRTSAKGPKYVFWDEIAGFVHRDQSVVVYHHLNRNGTHAQQVENLFEDMRRRFPNSEISAVTFRRGSRRAYFVIGAHQHKELLQRRLQTIESGLWSRHFILRS